MERVALVILAVWVLLGGAGYLVRVVFGLSRVAASACVVALYVACDLAALSYYGLNSTGVLGSAGMAVPCLVTITIILLRR